MIRTLFGLIGTLVSLGCFAQSNLPACPQDQNAFWTNCYGTLTFSNGNKYVGEFRDNKRNGQGTFTWATGTNYVGEFRDDKRNGRGTFTWADGTNYVGEFRDNNKNGQGTLTFSTGSKFVGEFRDDKRNGQGIRYNARGQITESGFYENNNLVNSAYVDPARFTNIQANSTRPSAGQSVVTSNSNSGSSGQRVTANTQADDPTENRQACYNSYDEWRAKYQGGDIGSVLFSGSACYLLKLKDLNCTLKGVDPSPFDGELKKCVAAERREWQPKCMGIEKATERCAPASNFDSCMGRLGYDREVRSRCEAIFGD